VSAHQIFMKALLHLRGRPGAGGWLGDFLSLWIEPKEHIHVWFAGENDKVRSWDFMVLADDVEAFTDAVPEAEYMNEAGYAGVQVWRVRAKK
jgi:hypothetical protein